MAKMGFGRVQMRIMQVLWKKRRATAREITDALNEFEPIAHSTVQTLLRTLEQKGAATHDVDERTFIFRPLVRNDRVVKTALKEFIDRVFNGSAEGMVSYLVKNEFVSPEEMKTISDLFIQRVFGGSAEDLVAFLVRNRYIDPGTLRKLGETVESDTGNQLRDTEEK
jgi:BlaI family transcriptional regulator, penicillinase repressor